MQVTVKLFARARDLAGTDRVVLELPGVACVADVRRGLATAFPTMAPLVPSLLVTVGNDYARDDVRVSPDAELACFPPVSGG
ncbi:MAG: MoaD/ThiS family protein [Planctomycetaceae bacterium]|nr:MoaD/ThiS family protein [Planctomycetaceae bacterium]